MGSMHYYEVAPTSIVRANAAMFTYRSDAAVAVGSIVTIPVGKKTLIGVIMKEVDKPDFATKEIESVLDQPPLPMPLLKSALWLSDYYKTPLATVWQTVLPRNVTKKRRLKHLETEIKSAKRTKYVFTKNQASATATLDTMDTGTALLHGVTGSGKTLVYIDAAKKAMLSGRSVVILVPEIALTSQLVREFSTHLANVYVTHSRQTEAERHLLWLKVLQSSEPLVIIGPRSALFMPLRDIGLIVIDESHEPSFKQEQAPRYSALRLASTLMSLHIGKLILGSATPLVSDYFLAKNSQRPIIEMTSPARSDTVKPKVFLIDMTKRANFSRHYFLSDALLTSLSKTFAAGRQALIFHNRRGSATVSLCENCGWSAGCPRCFVPLTLHADRHQLSCHICAASMPVPTACPVCQSVDILHRGIGTKRIEAELSKLFPHQTIARFDGDTESNLALEKRYHQLVDGSIDLIIGTQTVAKGLDLPELRTVGVIQADAGLSLPDFSSAERTFQLLAQVIGRVGRSHHATQVIVQSYQPNHPAITDGISQNYADFYERTIEARQATNFPPFSYLLKLTCTYKTEKAAISNAQKLAATLRIKAANHVQILGPTPSFYERVRDSYRWQLVIKSPSRHDLTTLLKHLPPAHWQYELDPISLL